MRTVTFALVALSFALPARGAAAGGDNPGNALEVRVRGEQRGVMTQRDGGGERIDGGDAKTLGSTGPVDRCPLGEVVHLARNEVEWLQHGAQPRLCRIAAQHLQELLEDDARDQDLVAFLDEAGVSVRPAGRPCAARAGEATSPALAPDRALERAP